MSAGWYFREMSQKESRQGDIPTKHALKQDTETFVREVLQNANDAGPVNEGEPIEVYFRFTRLTGKQCEQFKQKLRWNEELLTRLEVAAEEEQDLSLSQFLETGTNEIVLLTIEDRNTVGLSGAEDDDESNYTALVRDMHRSNKEETQGGSHGVGGTVLWAFSGVSTVLFTSVPEEASDSQVPRFVGRSYLPDHVYDGELHKGYGWFGVCDPSDREGRRVSAWGEQASQIASSLHSDRPDESGTSSTIVGFREPGESQPDADELADIIDTIRRAAVENFWPAIRRGKLNVYVQAPDDEEPQPADLDTVPGMLPFVDCYERFREENDQLGTPGEVATKHISFDFPRRSDGTSTPDQGEVTLSVRTADVSNDERRNQVAVFRGAGMVVQYVSMVDVARYGSDFHAVLVCGEARTQNGEDPSEVDAHVEHLLRAAEPAEHNEWTGTPRLKNQYKKSDGRVGTVTSLQGKKLRDALRELVAQESDSSNERLGDFEELFPLSDSGSSTSTASPSRPDERELNDLGFRGDHWSFDVTLKPADKRDGGWEARLWLTRLFEEGGDGENIEILSIEPVDNCADDVDFHTDDEGYAVVRGSSLEPVRVLCRSKRTGRPNPRSGRFTQTGVRHEFSDRGGDDE